MLNSFSDYLNVVVAYEPGTHCEDISESSLIVDILVGECGGMVYKCGSLDDFLDPLVYEAED